MNQRLWALRKRILGSFALLRNLRKHTWPFSMLELMSYANSKISPPAPSLQLSAARCLRAQISLSSQAVLVAGQAPYVGGELVFSWARYSDLSACFLAISRRLTASGIDGTAGLFSVAQGSLSTRLATNAPVLGKPCLRSQQLDCFALGTIY